MSPKTKGCLLNLSLALVSCVVALIVCEMAFRARYAHYFRAPQAAVMNVQSHLMPHPKLGYAWQPNISYQGGIILENKDVQFEPLSTDSNGVENIPEAIAARGQGAPVDVAGFGDSFIEHACRGFYEAFQKEGMLYYGFAIHRQCPPQYNILLEDYALPLKPKWVIYGLYENDYTETEDFENWQKSGMDWFAYHSGTWCGPPVDSSALLRFYQTHLRGARAMFKVVAEKIGRPPQAESTDPAVNGVGKVEQYVLKAHEMATSHGAQFILLIIPSKTTVLKKPTLESTLNDQLIAAMTQKGVTVLDLRPAFLNAPDKAALYYQIDGHWNRTGIDLAAKELLRIMRPAPADGS